MKFLDLGFGEFPHPNATHGVDIQSESSLTGLARRYGPVAVRNMKRFMSQKGHFFFDFDYTKHKLPYPDNYFDTVFSSHSIDIFGNAFAYKEAVRVLKKGGMLVIEIGSDDPAKHKKIVMTLKKLKLTRVGITSDDRRLFIFRGTK